MPDLKTVNPDEFEQQLRDCAQRAVNELSNVANKAIADVRTVAWTQSQLQAQTASDLVVESRVAMVQDVELRAEHGELRELEVGVSLGCEYKSMSGELRSGKLRVPPGKYRLLVFLVDQLQNPVEQLCSCAYAATAHAKTPQCPVVFSGVEDDE